MQIQFLCEGQIIGADAVEHRFAEVDQIHLVDGDDDVADAKQGYDVTVPAGLRLHTVAGVDQDDGQVAGRGAGRHVAGVLLMAGCVGNDEFAARGREIAVGHINGDALFPFGLQTVHQQRRIEIVAGGAEFRAVLANGSNLILIDHLGVMQQSADEGALAVIDVAAGQETQQFLALMLGEVFVDVTGDQVGLVCHQK